MDTLSSVLDTLSYTEIVHSLSEKLKAHYVFPEVAEQIVARLKHYLERGEYTALTTGEAFAAALTAHLQEVNHDQHLRVGWQADPLPEQAEALYQNPTWLAERHQQAQYNNYGFYKVERLPGNVGYLDLRAFMDPAVGGETAAAAMNFVAHTHALIIYLRQCHGGDPSMIALVSSYLFMGEPVHLNSLYWRDTESTQQFWTLPYVPGQRFGDKPIYALTSHETFSGGEEFVYNLQTRQRATLIGETTGGGAHPGDVYRLHPHFNVFIPTGRAINPITRTNWEGSGVVPDLSTAREAAFTVAYRLALKAVIDRLGDPTSSALKQLREEAQGALKELD